MKIALAALLAVLGAAKTYDPLREEDFLNYTFT